MGQKRLITCAWPEFVFTLPCLFSFANIYNSVISGCFVLTEDINFGIMCTTNNSVLEHVLAVKSLSRVYEDGMIIRKVT